MPKNLNQIHGMGKVPLTSELARKADQTSFGFGLGDIGLHFHAVSAKFRYVSGDAEATPKLA